MREFRVKVVYVTGETRETVTSAQTPAGAISRVLNWKSFRDDATPINVVRAAPADEPFPDPWEYKR